MNLKCAALMVVFLLATECMFRYFYKLTTLLGLLLTKKGRARAKQYLSRKVDSCKRLKEQHRANGGSWKDFFK